MAFRRDWLWMVRCSTKHLGRVCREHGPLGQDPRLVAGGLGEGSVQLAEIGCYRSKVKKYLKDQIIFHGQLLCFKKV